MSRRYYGIPPLEKFCIWLAKRVLVIPNRIGIAKPKNHAGISNIGNFTIRTVNLPLLNYNKKIIQAKFSCSKIFSCVLYINIHLHTLYHIDFIFMQREISFVLLLIE